MRRDQGREGSRTLRALPWLVEGYLVVKAAPIIAAIVCAVAAAGLAMATWWSRGSRPWLILGVVFLLAAAFALASAGFAHVYAD